MVPQQAEDGACGTSIGSPVQVDETIRPMCEGEACNLNLCWYKRFSSFVNGQQVFLWPCKENHKQKKYHWEYDQVSGQIKSIGSEKKFPNKAFCASFDKLNSEWKQRVKISPCRD